MSKTKNAAKHILVTLLSVVVALIIFASVFLAIYNIALKPADFQHNAPASGDGTGYYRHNYLELNENERYVYSVVLESIYNQPETIEIPRVSGVDWDTVFSAISHDNPDLFNIGLECHIYNKGYKTFFKPQYSITYEEYSAQLKEVQGIASAIAAEANKLTSLYEKEKYVHDYIINHCSYIEPEESVSANNVYGCLVLGRASCEGYSRSFQYIMNMLNVDNRLVTGESTDDGVNYIGHMWNYIILDGAGYYVDLTWDDPKTEGVMLRHTYFNVTTADISKKHRNIEQDIPQCNSTKYNYFIYEGAYLNVGAGATFESKVYNAVHYAKQRNYSCVELRFSNGAVMTQAKKSLFDDGIIYLAYVDAGINSQAEGSVVHYSADDKMNTICFFF